MWIAYFRISLYKSKVTKHSVEGVLKESGLCFINDLSGTRFRSAVVHFVVTRSARPLMPATPAGSVYCPLQAEQHTKCGEFLRVPQGVATRFPYPHKCSNFIHLYIVFVYTITVWLHINSSLSKILFRISQSWQKEYSLNSQFQICNRAKFQYREYNL